MAPGISNCGLYINNSMLKKEEICLPSTELSWEKLSQGLNVEALCENQFCKAYQKYVWTQIKPGIDRFGRINFIEFIARYLICPICKEPINENTVRSLGFYNCSYFFDGQVEFNSGQREDRHSDRTVAVAKNYFIKYEGSDGVHWRFLSMEVTFEQVSSSNSSICLLS